MRAAIYARVSSTKQRDADTIASQLDVLPRFCAARGWAVVGTYIDDGKSAKAGKLADRDGLARLLADAAARKFEVVAVLDLDRLTRSDDQRERAGILGALQFAGVRVAEYTTGLLHEQGTFAGDVLVSLRTLLAVEDNRKRSERTKLGRIRAAKEGRPPTRAPWGLAYAAGAWSTTDDAETVRAIFRRLLDGESLAMICHALNADGIASPRGRQWSRGNLRAIIVQSAYRGEWTVDGSTIRVPALVTPEDWHAAQHRLAANRQAGHSARTKRVYLLSGLGLCRCGGKIRVHEHRRTATKRWTYYECEWRWKRADGKRGCRSPGIRVEDADDLAWDATVRVLEGVDLADLLAEREDGNGWARDLTAAEKRLERLASAESGLLARYRRGIVTEKALDAELERIAADRRQSERQAAAARAALASDAERRDRSREALERLQELRRRAADAPAELRRDIVRVLLPWRGAVEFNGREITLGFEVLDGAEAQRVRLTA